MTGLASPALASSLDGAFSSPTLHALSESDMAGLRGGAGLLGFSPGSHTFVQLGGATSSQDQTGTPSSASTSATGSGTTATTTASLSNGSTTFTSPVGGSMSSTTSISRSSTFVIHF